MFEITKDEKDRPQIKGVAEKILQLDNKIRNYKTTIYT